jgi:hypothetical protein
LTEIFEKVIGLSLYRVWVIGLVYVLLDIPHIWCIVIRLFMRPITPSSRPVTDNRMSYRAGGYRALWWILVIGLSCLIILFSVIGLGKIIQNKIGQDSSGRDSRSNVDYYPEGGILSMMRYARSLPQQ